MTLGAVEAAAKRRARPQFAQDRDRLMIALAENRRRLDRSDYSDLLEDRESLIRDAHEAGITWTDIGEAAGITHRRAQQILKSLQDRDTPSGQDDGHD
jgi:hypothetical protein